jgi:hypothetical protein
LGLGASRGLASFQLTSALQILIPMFRGGLFACLRASAADFSSSPAQLSRAWIQLSLCAVAGALASPVFRRFKSPLASPLVGLALAALVATKGEEETSSYHEVNLLVSCSPLSFSTLLTDRPKIALASFLSELAAVAMDASILASAAGSSRDRVRLTVALVGASLCGSGVAAGVQAKVGLAQQAKLASAAQILVAGLLAGGEPTLAAVLSVLARRAGDEADTNFFEEEDANHGERAGGLGNLKALAGVAGTFAPAFVQATYGPEAGAGVLAVSAMGAAIARSRMVKQIE